MTKNKDSTKGEEFISSCINDNVVDKQESSVHRDNKKTKRFTYIEVKCKAIKVLKFIMGLYLVSMAVGLNEILMVNIAPTIETLSTSSIMTVELVSWASFLVGPLRFMLNLMMWYGPTLVIMLLLNKLVSKFKYVTKQELEVFKYMTIIILVIFLK